MKVTIRFSEGCQPAYMTPESSHCDLYCKTATRIPAGEVVAVPTGVWIESAKYSDLSSELIPELQIRCRSSFPIKRQLMLANGVGTIDVDFPDEIHVLLYNFGKKDAELPVGERIAQMSVGTVYRVSGAKLAPNKRTGGFGSTGSKD